MHQHFPLSERMWLEWLEDESSTAATVEDVRSLERLLQESHGDYLSVSLWKEHLQVLQAMLQQGGATLVDVRQAYDQALEQCDVLMAAKESYISWIGSSESEEDGDGVPKNMMKAIERAQRAYELREECEKNIETAKGSDLGVIRISLHTCPISTWKSLEEWMRGLE
eukprot:jgi/Picre1/35730/NNA_003190.t1